MEEKLCEYLVNFGLLKADEGRLYLLYLDCGGIGSDRIHPECYRNQISGGWI